MLPPQCFHVSQFVTKEITRHYRCISVLVSRDARGPNSSSNARSTRVRRAPTPTPEIGAQGAQWVCFIFCAPNLPRQRAFRCKQSPLCIACPRVSRGVFPSVCHRLILGMMKFGLTEHISRFVSRFVNPLDANSAQTRFGILPRVSGTRATSVSMTCTTPICKI